MAEINLAKKEVEGVKQFLRLREKISWYEAVSLMIFGLVCSGFLDFARFSWLFWLRWSGRGKIILFASNANHLANIRRYSPRLANDCAVIKIKSSRSWNAIPQASLNVTALYRVLFTQSYRQKSYSRLDLAEATFAESVRYLRWLMTITKCKTVLLSREDSRPFVEVGRAAQSLGLNLNVFEHGIFTRNHESFETHANTVHIYTSEFNIKKRDPVATNIYKLNSPLYKLASDVAAFKSEHSVKAAEILIADTYNIRKYLLDLAYLMRDMSAVKIRLHPGHSMDCGEFESRVGKIEALASAKLVVTGISGFAIEAAFCGIPTIILYAPDDEWGMASLGDLRAAPQLQIVELRRFLDSPDEFLHFPKPCSEQLVMWRKEMGFLNEKNDCSSFAELRRYVE